MLEDAELLRRHFKDRSDDAFAELVGRHLNLVYSTALRTLNGDAHSARDVTQEVFIKLAKHRPSVAGDQILSGWLYTTAHRTAITVVRSKIRRRRWEQEAQTMQETNAEAHTDWSRVRPVLDETIHQLDGPDRDAIVLRFFERQPFAEIASKLGLSENAARMRVGRALDKLHGLLGRRGIRSTSGALAILLADEAIVAAPAGLDVTVTGAGLAARMAAASKIAILDLITSMTTLKTASLIGLVGLSLTANALLIAGLAAGGGHGPSGAHPEAVTVPAGERAPRAAGSSERPPAAGAVPGVSAAPSFRTGPTVFSQLLSDDPATFAANLLAVGFPRDATRGGVEALLKFQYSVARAAAFRTNQPPYWQTKDSDRLTPALATLLSETSATRIKTMRELFPEDEEKYTLELRRRYSSLPVAKLNQLEELDRAYALLSQPSALRMPWDAERLAALGEERLKDLRAILTPEEFEQHSFHTSPVAAAIRLLPAFDPSEAEFRTIFSLRSAFEEKSRATAGDPAAARQQDLNNQIRAALGDVRFADYQRSSDPGFQVAHALTQQLNLPSGNATAVYDIQRETVARAAAIRRQPGQTPEQLAMELRQLAETAHQRLAPLLTPAGLDAFKRRGGAWLLSLDRPPPARR